MALHEDQINKFIKLKLIILLAKFEVLEAVNPIRSDIRL